MEENARWRHLYDGSGHFLWKEKRSSNSTIVYLCISYLRVNLKKIPKTSAASFDFMHFVLLLYVVQPRVF